MDDTRTSRQPVGSIVRGLVLLVLVLLVAPAVARDGDVLAFPVFALVSLAAIAVAVAGLAYWLAVVGAPAGWLARRLRVTPDRFLIAGAFGVACAAAVALGWFRLELDRRHSPLAQFDLRAAATAARLSSERSLMQTLNMAGIHSMVFGAVMLVVAALVTRAFRSAALLAATVALGGALVEVLKTNPAVPLPALGEVTRGTTSWPSGHAALQCSLAFGIVLWWWAAGLPRPTIAAAVLLPLAALVGYSRAYLGIHLLSEVISGWCVAALAASIVLIADRLLAKRLLAKRLRAKRLRAKRLRAPASPRPWRVVTAGAAAVLVTAVAVHSVHRFHDRGPATFPGYVSSPDVGFAGSARSFPPVRLASADPAAVLAPLPRFSETLLGHHAQPLGLVVIADADELQDATERAGWAEAHVFTPRHLASDFWAGLSGGAAHNAPIAPTFFDTRAADVVLQHRVPGRRAESEVAELWQVPLVTPHGCSVWAVTASLDSRSDWTLGTLFPERHIAPAIDATRDALAVAIGASGRLDDLGRFRFVGPMRGTTPAGSYSTDGKVALLRQPGC